MLTLVLFMQYVIKIEFCCIQISLATCSEVKCELNLLQLQNRRRFLSYLLTINSALF